MRVFTRSLVVVEQIIYSIVNFGLMFLFARYLSPLEFGIWSFIFLLVTFNITIFSSLFFQPIMVRISRMEVETHFVPSVFSLVLFFSLGLSFLESTLLWIKTGASRDVVALSMGYLTVINLYELLRRIEMAYMSYFKLWVLGILRLGYAGVVAGVMMYYGVGLREILIISLLLFSVIVMGWYGAFWKKWFFQEYFSHLKKTFKVLWEESGKWLFGRALLQFFSNQLYMVLVAMVRGAISLGEFQLVRLVFSPLVVIAQGVHNLLLPILSRWYKLREERIWGLMRIIFWMGLILSLMYVFLVCVGTPFIVDVLWQGKYDLSRYLQLLLIFLGAPFASSMIFILVAMFLAVDRADYVFSVSKKIFGINLLIAPFLVLKFGLKGALLGNSLVQMISLGLYVYSLRQVYNESRHFRPKH